MENRVGVPFQSASAPTAGWEGSSNQSLEIGTAVSVRYPPADPAKAVIADFQNQWGGVFALALFGGFPLLGGLFFLFTAIGGARARRGLSACDAAPSGPAHLL